MTTLSGIAGPTAPAPTGRNPNPAAEITRSSSVQTYYTIRLLADRDRTADAYRAYAYFRWVDDRIDDESGSSPEKTAFLRRQQSLLDAGYRGAMPGDLCPMEALLAEMIIADGEPDSGLQAYLRNMMAVMAFDLERRGRPVSAAELENYSRLLATAVSEALLHFIGHNCPAPCGESRHSAVFGAHIIHMLRDTIEDTAAGYYNIPAEYLDAHGIAAGDTDHPAWRQWTRDRVALARRCFEDGRRFTAQVQNRRCRLAGHAYIARFEWMARLIERDGYRLRPCYPERKSRRAAAWMVWRTIREVMRYEIRDTS